MATGIPIINHPAQIRESCLVGKHSRQHFRVETTFRAAQPLELVHGDLCGPITPATQAGNRYIFLLVDDFSRYMWSFMIKTKDEAFNTFKKFKQQNPVASQTGPGCGICFVRTLILRLIEKSRGSHPQNSLVFVCVISVFSKGKSRKKDSRDFRLDILKQSF